MRILILILATLVVHTIAEKNATVTKLKPVPKAGKPGEFRDKRTLYTFGNYGYNNQQSFARNKQPAQRRISNYNHDYYPQDSYSGQFGGPPNSYVPDTNNNYLDQPPPYYHHSAQPHYVESPEPIIEIIIKESNETLPEPAPQPHFIKKKKKEQVQVFYVNYKKGQNDKLQLENPIPALTPLGYHNGPEQEEEEEHEIIQPVTPLPKLRTTTLRTVIHPESEKFHSNSGIHVSFNAEDKYQSGHQLQEHNEGSEIKSVVALPNPQFPPNHRPSYQSAPLQSNNQHYASHQTHQSFQSHANSPNHQTFQSHVSSPNHQSFLSQTISPNHQNFQQEPNHRFQSNFRTDYSRSQPNFNSDFRTPNYQPSQATHLHPVSNQFQQQQQQQSLPNHQPANYNGFSSQQNSHNRFSGQQNSHNGYRHNSFHSQQPVTHLTPRSPPFIPQNTTPRYPSAPQHLAPQGSQYNRPPPPQQQPPRKQQIYFPNDAGAKTQIKSHVNYQPLKYNQPQSGPHKPIPIPLHSIQSENQQQSYNRPLSFGPPSQAPPPQYTQQSQPENNPPQPHFRPRPPSQYPSQPIHSNPPQFGHSSPQPQPPSAPPPQQQQHFQQNKFFAPGPVNNNGFNQAHNTNPEPNKFFQPGPPFSQSHNSNHESNKFFQPGPPNNEGISGFNQAQPHNQNLNPENPLENLNVPFLGNFNSEFIKSVPRFEQHYTETIGPSPPTFTGNVNEPQKPAYSGNVNEPQKPVYTGNVNEQQNPVYPGNVNEPQKPVYNEYPYTSHSNQNNVIQTVPSPNLGPTTPQPLQHHPSSTPGFGLSSPSSHHLQNFQTHQQHNFPSSTLNSVFPGDSSTPSPQYSQRNPDHLQIVTAAPSNNYYSQHQSFDAFNQNNVQPQIIHNSQPLPQKLPPPGHSVSTIHTEALKELERLKSNYFAANQQFDAQPLNHQFNQQDFVSISGRNQYSVDQHDSTQFAPNHRYQQSAQSTTTTTTTTTEAPTTTTTTEKPKSQSNPNLVLPDEVPEDLRQQLFSSGILDNADISVLDYDKLGDTALENLPPEHLAHFYGAGGGSQISGSSKVLSVVKPNGDKVSISDKQKFKEHQSLPKRENLDLKVVRFDSTNQKSITDKYIRPDAKILAPVELNSPSFNRYLPLKVNGAQFPLPDVQELKGKRVSSVVVLAPVDPQQEVDEADSFESRQERGLPEEKRIKFIAGDSLKQLLKKPTRENFKRWLEKESRTDIDFQSVVLLVTKNNFDQQEIFMYDISTKEINKLNGALSTAFVNVAEENANSQDIDNASITDSGIVERMTPVRKQDAIVNVSKDSIVKFSSKIQSRRDDESHPVYINSGYSVIKK